MESVKIQGTIIAIHPVEVKSENFSVQKFAIKEDAEQYPNAFEVQCTGKTIGVLNDYRVGQKVTVQANLNGREYTNKTNGQQGIFMSLGLWKIEAMQQATQQAPQQAAPQQQSAPTDSLPF